MDLVRSCSDLVRTLFGPRSEVFGPRSEVFKFCSEVLGSVQPADRLEGNGHPSSYLFLVPCLCKWVRFSRNLNHDGEDGSSERYLNGRVYARGNLWTEEHWVLWVRGLAMLLKEGRYAGTYFMRCFCGCRKEYEENARA